MGVFFVSWQLWEEMTFVLACAIVLVFLVGIFKLWRTSQQMRRQEVLDEEKRARLTEMHRVGLSPTHTRARKPHGSSSDIPFGVRAIQTGVEVDGIWISRPTTPSLGSSQSQSKILLVDAGAGAGHGSSAAEGRRLLSGDYRPYPGSALSQSVTHMTFASSSSPSSAHSHSHANESHALVDDRFSVPAALPQASAHTAARRSSRANATSTRSGSSALSEEALRRLEGTYSPTGFAAPGGGGSSNTALRPPLLNTYIPSSRVSSPSPSVGQHHHEGISTGLAGPGSRRNRNNSTSSRSSSSSQQASSSDNKRQPLLQAHAMQSPQQHCAYTSYRGYYTHPVPSPAVPRSAASAPLPPSSLHETTAFPGDARANQVSRKVNPSFEVLPAGTFARGSGGANGKGSLAAAQMPASSNGSNADDEADTPPQAAAATAATADTAKPEPPARNKLRQKPYPVR